MQTEKEAETPILELLTKIPHSDESETIRSVLRQLIEMVGK
jgi:hypothetical protein